MKCQISFLFLCMTSLIFCSGCDKKDDDKGFVLGKNRYTTSVDNIEREYFVHVPHSYTGDEALPVVFMLHGTSGNGNEFWEKSGWKEVGEAENVLTVFPSSLRYCIIDPVDGQKSTTKWNSQPAEWSPCDGVTLADDIKFFHVILDELETRFHVDVKRIYLVGFSNGGQMAAKCSIELSERLAAIVEAAGSFWPDTTFVPHRPLPVTYQLGNEDYGPGGTGPTIPLSSLDSVLARTDIRPGKPCQTHVKSFGLSSDYVTTGDTNTAVIATFPSLTPGSINDFRFVFVHGLAHAYPDGTDGHWLHSAEVHWQWLRQYSLP